MLKQESPKGLKEAFASVNFIHFGILLFVNLFF